MKQKINDLRNRISYGWIILAVVLMIALICIFCIFDSVAVIGNSMLPNFVGGKVNGDVIAVRGDKVIISKIYGIERGDVIVFKSAELNESLIKRVIGVEGDTVEIKNNLLYLNGAKVNETYIKEPMTSISGVWKVGKNEVFVLGDNRNNSEDSRYFGCVSTKNIQGEVVIRVSADGKIYFI